MADAFSQNLEHVWCCKHQLVLNQHVPSSEVCNSLEYKSLHILRRPDISRRALTFDVDC